MVTRHKQKLPGPTLVFVTTTVRDWAPVFCHVPTANGVVKQLRHTASYLGVSIVGYVLIPSHLHALLGLPDRGLLPKFMQSFKSLSSRFVKSCCPSKFRTHFIVGKGFRLWMPRYDCVQITSEKHFTVKLEYIHDNPRRAGLVFRAEDWPYSSAGDWLSDQSGAIEIDKDFRWTG